MQFSGQYFAQSKVLSLYALGELRGIQNCPIPASAVRTRTVDAGWSDCLHGLRTGRLVDEKTLHPSSTGMSAQFLGWEAIGFVFEASPISVELHKVRFLPSLASSVIAQAPLGRSERLEIGI